MRTSNPAYSCFIVSMVFFLHVCNIHKLINILIAGVKFHAEIEFLLWYSSRNFCTWNLVSLTKIFIAV
jgi:hypothetical protein